MSVTIKTSFTTPRGDVDTRRFQLSASSDKYAQLHAFLDSTYGRLYGLSALSSQYALSYVDPDGDECSINSELELQEAIRCAQEDSKTLKVKVKTEDAVHVSRPSSVASSRADEPSVSAGSASASFNSSSSQPGRVRAVDEEEEYDIVDSEGSSQPSAPAAVEPVTAAFKSISLSAPQQEDEEQKEQVDEQKEGATSAAAPKPAVPASTVTVEDVSEEEREEDALLAAIIDSTKQAATSAAVAAPPASTQQPTDSAAAPADDTPAVHHGIVCDICNVTPIVGIRYKCAQCADYDLCEMCEASGVHPAAHQLIKMKQPRSANHWWRSGGGHHGPHHGFGGGHGGHHGFGHGMGGRFGGGFGGGRHGGWHHRRAAEAAAAAAAAGTTSGDASTAASTATSAAFTGCRWGDHADRPKAAFIGDVTLADGITVKPGQILQKVWQVRNTGDKAWPAGTRLQFIGGDVTPFTAAGAATADASWSDAAVVPVAEPGQIINLALDIQVPQQLGRFRGTFRLVTAEGVRFGPRIWIDLEVSDEESTTGAAAASASADAAATSPSAAAAPAASEPAQSESAPASPQPQADPRTAIHQAVQSVLTALGGAGNGTGNNALHTLATAFQSAAASIQQHASAAAERVQIGRQPAPFLYPAELEQIKALGLGFDDERVKALLIRYRGRVDRTVNELFNQQ